MMAKIRIKDIAEMSGVSVGTVDRVLHDRPNVSPDARKKVEEVLAKINFKPNIYASALAYNKDYTFYVILPEHSSEAYWSEIEEGVKKAVEHRNDFNINVEILYYKRYESEDFISKCTACIEAKPSAVVLVPTFPEITKTFTDKLHASNIPLILLDSYIPELNPLSFFGQDSFSSGYFAAKMLMLLASDDKRIAIVKQKKDGKVSSRQQENREIGFRNYMRSHFPNVEILELDLPLDVSNEQYSELLEAFFDEHEDIHHCITLSSKAYLVGEFLLQTRRSDVKIMGYDMVPRNAECLRKGSISFLIAQHAFMQGFHAIDSLFKYLAFKQEVKSVNYMPIELLSKENVDFYHRTLI
ncbi:MAG: LacI family DNA-binding transcriptional regulator [Bacteroidaceae bacterium]|nr:LacI family DNA-binding transcriptional regulator [Bacteroidaceae bacterium]